MQTDPDFLSIRAINATERKAAAYRLLADCCTMRYSMEYDGLTLSDDDLEHLEYAELKALEALESLKDTGA